MPDRPKEIYNLCRVGAVFAGACLALLAALVWWMVIDRDRPWHAWQRRQAEMLEAIAHTDLVAAGSEVFERELADAEAAAATADDPRQAETFQRRFSALVRFDSHARDRAAWLADWTQPSWSDWPVLGRLLRSFSSSDWAVRQVEPEHVWRDLHFTRAKRTDRCMTCHVAIADPRFTKRSLATRFERTLRLVNRAREAAGEPPLPLPVLPGCDDVEPGHVTDHWASLTDRQRDVLFEQLVEKFNSYQMTRGRPALHAAAPLLAHPQLELQAGEHSAHPIAQMGCTICHEGHGGATDFLLAGHTASTSAQQRRWERIYTPTVAGGLAVHTSESAAKRWDRPMWPLDSIQASCTVCHLGVADLAMYQGRKVNNRIDRGRTLYELRGCANCHLVDEVDDAPRIGPDLTYMSDKLTRPFMQHWILEPRGRRPATRMPEFFGQENNDAPSSHTKGEPDPALRARAEAIAMTEYLRWVGRPAFPEVPPAGLWKRVGDLAAAEVRVSAERGRRFTDALGCLGCHAILGHRPDDEAGRPLDPLGVEWIGYDLADRMEAELRAPNPDRPLTADELDAIEDAAFTQAEKMSYVQQVRYARDFLDSDETTLFDPEGVDDFVFTTRGPELTGLAAKFEDARRAVLWIYDYLRDPRRFNPDAQMPRMRLERKVAADDAQAVVSDEALDIAVYLAGLEAVGTDNLQPLDDDPAMKRQLEFTRDALIARRLARFGTETGEPDEVSAEILVNRLADRFGRSGAEARVGGLDPSRRAWVFLGEQMVGHYGCFGCHSIPGFERAERIGPEHNEWGRVPLDRLDFGLLDPRFPERAEGRRLADTLYPRDRPALIARAGANPPLDVEPTRASFAWHKVRNPRLWDRGLNKAIYDKLRMPNVYLDDEQAASLVTWLLSRRPAEVEPAVQVAEDGRSPADRVAVGRLLARELNCVACHRIDGNAAVLDQYHWVWRGMQYVFDEDSATPSLDGVGARTRPDWQIGYLADVEVIRPHLDIRMPQYTLTSDESEQLAGYLAGVDQAEAQRLAELLRQWHKELETAGLPAWLAAALPDETGEEALQRYAVDNRLTTAALVDAATTDPLALDRLNTRIADDAAFLCDVLDTSYPFAEPSPPPSSPERLADGRTLFTALDCLSCHVFGDPMAPGANARPTAPNLDRTYERLRYPWVKNWLARTHVVRPGTKMPSHFGDGDRSALADFPPEQRERIREALNDAALADDAAAQIRAIADCLFDASRRGLDIVVPSSPPPETAPAATGPSS